MLSNNSKHLIKLSKNIFSQKPDFSWEFGCRDYDCENDSDYRMLLKRNYFYNELTNKLYTKSPFERHDCADFPGKSVCGSVYFE